jgi:hypothetical protein
VKLPLALSIAAVTALGAPALAAITILADGNTEARIEDSGSLAGMNTWSIDRINNLSLQGFWFRTQGMTREQNIGTLALTGTVVTDTNTFSDPRPDTLALRYSGPGFTIEPSWSVRGGSPGDSRSDIAETIAIRNTSSVPLAISFFQYSDFDLGGTVADQSVEILGFGNNTARQTDVGFVAQETVVTPRPSRFEVGFFPSILNRLNDANTDDLQNVAGPLGPGDLTWAYQWDFVIPANSSALISKNKQIVPAPGAVALIMLGGLVVFSRRR